jgi:hypothetical protein
MAAPWKGAAFERLLFARNSLDKAQVGASRAPFQGVSEGSPIVSRSAHLP